MVTTNENSIYHMLRLNYTPNIYFNILEKKTFWMKQWGLLLKSESMNKERIVRIKNAFRNLQSRLRTFLVCHLISH